MINRGRDRSEVLACLFVENAGNLICPAGFDLGAHKEVVISSIPEGMISRSSTS